VVKGEMLLDIEDVRVTEGGEGVCVGGGRGKWRR
jgi:hypothetical protein